MKKLLLTLFLTLLAYPAFAYTILNTTTGQIEESTDIPEITRTVEHLVNGTKVTYQIDKVLLNADPIIEGAYYPTLSGFGQINVEGKAWLPVRLDRFTVSAANSASFQVLEQETMTINLTLSPGRALHTANEDYTYTVDNLPPITSSAEYFPSTPLSSNGCQIYRDVTFFGVQVTPIQYSSATQTMRVYKKISYIVEDVISNDIDFSRVKQTDNVYKSLNNTGSANNGRKRDIGIIDMDFPAPQSLLIITHDKVNDSANEFYWLKKRKGYNVSIVSASKWTPETIKETVKNFYDNDRHAEYLVLFGDHKLIPTEKFDNIVPYDDSTLASDMYYACMDGPNDNIPDLFYGRIPVANNDEGYAVVHKIGLYEKDPNNGSNTTRFSGIAYFQDEVKNNNTLIKECDGIEDENFVRTVETILQNVDDVFSSVGRVYCTKSTVSPKNFKWRSNNDIFPFPDFLKSEDAWKGNERNVFDEFNNGTNFMLHIDHGTDSCWSYPYVANYYTGNLHNDKVFPIMFSMNCHSGNFVYDYNFAKYFLKKANAGPVSIIAATVNSYCVLNDIMALTMMNSIWPNKNFVYYHNPSMLSPYELGEALTLGEALALSLYRLDEINSPTWNQKDILHQRLIYHCLGDPSLYMYWGADYGIEENLSIMYYDGYLDIRVRNNIPCYISYWDSTNGYFERKLTTHLSTDYNKYISPETYVYVYRNGMKPICVLAGYDNPYNPYSNSLVESHIINVTLDNDELNIELECNNLNNLSVVVSESSNINTMANVTHVVDNETVTHKVKNSNARYFFIKLQKDNEVIDYKTILKTN